MNEWELYAERLRIEAAKGNPQGFTTDLDRLVRTKIIEFWAIAIEDAQARNALSRRGSPGNIRRRTRLSIGKSLTASDLSSDIFSTSAEALSILEACHEALVEEHCDIEAEAFRLQVNRVLEAHLVGFRLTESSMIIPVESQELQQAVVSPAVHLLHGSDRFNDAEVAYMDALRELREGNAGDAITDAGTALQDAFKAIGVSGNVLGRQITDARKRGLFGGVDTPLGDVLEKTANWIARRRNNGEAHTAAHNASLDQAWLVVHVVGAVIVYLASVRPEDGA